MYHDRITLSSKDILEKDFKIDARGYRLQEVDKFLDIIIKDYNESLKQEVRNLKSNMEALKYSEKEVTNVDLIRRVSQLEKIILGKENN